MNLSPRSEFYAKSRGLGRNPYPRIDIMHVMDDGCTPDSRRIFPPFLTCLVHVPRSEIPGRLEAFRTNYMAGLVNSACLLLKQPVRLTKLSRDEAGKTCLRAYTCKDRQQS